jgi:hypothetical protein
MATHDLSFATVCGALIVIVVPRESLRITPMRVLPAPEPGRRAIVNPADPQLQVGVGVGTGVQVMKTGPCIRS